MSDEVTKDVISQFLPTRKRKQRTKKPSQSGGTNATGTITVQSPQASATVSAGGTQAAKVMKTDEEGTIQTIIVNSAEEAANVVKDIKKEASADGASVIDSKDGIISRFLGFRFRELEGSLSSFPVHCFRNQEQVPVGAAGHMSDLPSRDSPVPQPASPLGAAAL